MTAQIVSPTNVVVDVATLVALAGVEVPDIIPRSVLKLSMIMGS